MLSYTGPVSEVSRSFQTVPVCPQRQAVALSAVKLLRCLCTADSCRNATSTSVLAASSCTCVGLTSVEIVVYLAGET